MRRSFDQVADCYDATRGLPPSVVPRVAAGLVALVDATAATLFFEPGVGTGRIAVPVIALGHRYLGCDVSAKMLARLRAKLPADAPPLLLRADVRALPLPDACVDVALTAHLLHLVADRDAALAEIRRVLRPGGVYLHCSGGGGRWQTELHRAWVAIANQHGVGLRERPDLDAPVADRLRAQGAALSSHRLATWRSEVTVAESVRRIAERSYSSYWEIAEPTFAAMLAELRAWVAARYPDDGQVLAYDSAFDVVAARGWSERTA